VCSKAVPGAKRLAVALALLIAVQSGAALARERDRPTPSGLPVPRWVSLKFAEVNARQGPGDDYATVWVYRAKRLPVQVVEETREWRKVRDPEGGTAWVHRRTVDGVRTVFNPSNQQLPLRAGPKADSHVRALLAPRAVANLEKCERGWCRVEAGGVKGWAPAPTLWGADESRP
jgi:SH3-like domain-containing protein